MGTRQYYKDGVRVFEFFRDDEPQQAQRPLPGRHAGFYQQQWQAAVNDKKRRGIPVALAIAQVEREHPGLRLRMLNEVNGGRY